LIPIQIKAGGHFMAYNYAKEKRKFDAEWKQKALWYRKEGMSE